MRIPSLSLDCKYLCGGMCQLLFQQYNMTDFRRGSEEFMLWLRLRGVLWVGRIETWELIAVLSQISGPSNPGSSL